MISDKVSFPPMVKIKAINRLLTRHPSGLLRVAVSPVHDFRSSPGVLLARGSESQLRVCMCLPRWNEKAGPQRDAISSQWKRTRSAKENRP